jgi:lipopolysaccharide/colanic/teichoic acid biosynthesis glycosyltransferase
LSREGFYLRRGKRALDVVASTAALAIGWPLLAGVAAIVRVSLGTPVFFRQKRPGHHGKPFTLYKFRTMTDARDAAGRLLSDAERLSPVGSFLRSSSLDELPELVNVLRGDMSLVGPRPLLMEYLPLYSERQARRHDVRPGITGWAQVNGRNAISWAEKFDLDLWYVENCSFWLDLEILARTLVGVVAQRGISHGGDATMPPFGGLDSA